MSASGATAGLSLNERAQAQLSILLVCEAVHGGACVTVRGAGRRLNLAEGEGLDPVVLATLKADGLVGSASRERFTKMVTAYWLTLMGQRLAREIDLVRAPTSGPTWAQQEAERSELVAHEPPNPHAVQR